VRCRKGPLWKPLGLKLGEGKHYTDFGKKKQEPLTQIKKSHKKNDLNNPMRKKIRNCPAREKTFSQEDPGTKISSQDDTYSCQGESKIIESSSTNMGTKRNTARTARREATSPKVWSRPCLLFKSPRGKTGNVLITPNTQRKSRLHSGEAANKNRNKGQFKLQRGVTLEEIQEDVGSGRSTGRNIQEKKSQALTRGKLTPRKRQTCQKKWEKAPFRKGEGKRGGKGGTHAGR